MLQSTDEQDDDLFLQFVTDSNAKVQSAISRYIDTPIGEGSEFFSRCRDASLAYARSLHAIDIELVDKSKSYLDKYNVELYGEDGSTDYPQTGGLIQELIATRNNRTETILATFDPREQKVTLPTQNDLFVSQRFG
jgi:hypothetical protein